MQFKKMMQVKKELMQAATMLKTISLISAVSIFSVLGTPSFAQEGYTIEEEEACAGDAFRLCSAMIPDIPKITACMEAKKDQLSPRCAKLFRSEHSPDR